MGTEEKLDKLSKYVKTQQIAAADNYKHQSKRRLQKIVETKINTTMIGALSAIEQKLGFLWKNGQLDSKQVKMLEIWNELRTEILNNGNNQKRAVLAEIDQYEVEWKRYHMDLHVAERQKEEGRVNE